METGTGVITPNDLMSRLVQARKVMKKVETGDYKTGYIDENILTSDPEILAQKVQSGEVTQRSTTPLDSVNINKINESKLPEEIKKAMIERPIQQISLNDTIDINSDFVKNTKRLMENEGLDVYNKNNKEIKSFTSQRPTPTQTNINSNDLILQLTPIIENIVRKTIIDILDNKLTQILTAKDTMSINENLVLKVGNSIFKGNITGVKKAK